MLRTHIDFGPLAGALDFVGHLEAGGTVVGAAETPRVLLIGTGHRPRLILGLVVAVDPHTSSGQMRPELLAFGFAPSGDGGPEGFDRSQIPVLQRPQRALLLIGPILGSDAAFLSALDPGLLKPAFGGADHRIGEATHRESSVPQPAHRGPDATLVAG